MKLGKKGPSLFMGGIALQILVARVVHGLLFEFPSQESRTQPVSLLSLWKLSGETIQTM